MARPVPVFGSHIEMASASEGPQHVRVFHEGRFLYASWDGGREAVLDIHAHDRAELLHYLEEWTRPAAPVYAEPRHERMPERPASEAQLDYLTSLSPAPKPKKRRMTLAEFLVS